MGTSGATKSQMGVGQVTAMLELRKSIEIAARAETIFGALTDPDKITAYFPVDSVHLEPRRAGVIELKGEIEGRPFTDHGVVKEFDRPTRFAYEYWSTNHGTERPNANHMTIDYRIESDGHDSCFLYLHHVNLLTLNRVQEMDGVWDFLLASFKQFVENE